ncbi:ABC transporter substrate-binding protein [Caloranaerobacter azorensis]|uniref:ABC transporter substrate-binding protein n=1 Tax=Caloranaerobacter azorensis TaxID=116090 RepID=A0A6P1YDJ9_9FIRM|nr:ABC transporter substrate-binding protein [Caloranaerobacter azorensis]QIB27429.1 ABC transporter substrate-binding protein [Caloranaerobacter azorensis]
MNIKKYLSLLLVVLMTFTIFTGCTNENTKISNTNGNEKIQNEYGIKIDENTVTFTDARGKSVVYEKNPKRVVCIYNSYLDLWYKCGGTVIGRVKPSKDKPVPGSENAEIVGTAGSPSVEKILALKPDLVILSMAFRAHRNIIETLEQNNIKVIALDNEYKDDYFKTVRLFTALTGREDLYEKYAKQVKKDIDNIIQKVPKDKKPKVLIIFATAKNITVRGTDSMVGEMLKDLNTINISGVIGDSADAKVFSMEKILQEDPDFIFVQTMGSDKEKIFKKLKSDVESNPAWASLTAVKNNRYIILPKDLYLYKPNDRYAEAYEGLAKILYPEVFDK